MWRTLPGCQVWSRAKGSKWEWKEKKRQRRCWEADDFSEGTKGTHTLLQETHSVSLFELWKATQLSIFTFQSHRKSYNCNLSRSPCHFAKITNVFNFISILKQGEMPFFHHSSLTFSFSRLKTSKLFMLFQLCFIVSYRATFRMVIWLKNLNKRLNGLK